MTKNYFITGLFLFLLNFLTLSAQAQTSGTIQGSVIDSAAKTPVDYMTIAIKKDKEVIKTVVTDASGKFSFNKIAEGKYTLTAMAVGYKTKDIAIEITEKNNTVNTGSLFVVAQNNNLQEVSVSADRPIIKQEADRITYDIQADPENKIMTALDMMRKVPLLSLDADENIKLKGSGNYKILINGKPSSMVARSPTDVLRSMPASSIQKIEVITTPPAKYDSEGLAGIINIITNKKIDNGYKGSLNSRMQGPVGGPQLGGYLTVKQNKFGVTVNSGTGYYSSPETESFSSRVTTGDNPTNLLNVGTRKFNNVFRYLGAELSYEIDTLNLITAEINPYGGHNNSTRNQAFSLTGGDQDVSYNLFSKNKYQWGGLDATLNYQLGFKSNKARLLTFSYKYNNSSNPQENNVMTTNRLNFTDPDYIQNNDSRSKEQTIQLDYVHPVKKLNIEAGLKGILRDNNSDFEYRNFNNASNNYEIDPLRTNIFKNNQDIVGLYNSYSYNLDSWSFKAGARIERTFVKADFITTASNVHSDYSNLIPSFSINHKFKNMSNVNFGFTQRIERPGIDNLNPFVDRSVPNFESTGNPDLKAVLSNNLELGYSRFKKGSINLGLSYNFANNTIQRVSTYDPVTQITSSTYMNVGKDKALTSNLNINYPLTPKWNLSLSGNLGYTWLEGTIDGAVTKNSGVTGYAYLNTGYKFEHEWKANMGLSYYAPDVMLQGKSGGNVYMFFSGSKEIIKDKLTVSGSFGNPFMKYRTYVNNTSGANFTQNSRSQNYNRSFSIGLNWRFGKLQDELKKNQRSISNDDVKSGGNKG